MKLSARDVEKYRIEAYERFYFGPSYILRIALKLWNPKEAKGSLEVPGQ